MYIHVRAHAHAYMYIHSRTRARMHVKSTGTGCPAWQCCLSSRYYPSHERLEGGWPSPSLGPLSVCYVFVLFCSSVFDVLWFLSFFFLCSWCSSHYHCFVLFCHFCYCVQPPKKFPPPKKSTAICACALDSLMIQTAQPM